MEQFIINLYVWLGNIAEWFSKPLFNFAAAANIFGITSFLLGVVGATAPCQLTSNSSAIALVTKNMDKKKIWVKTGYFIVGKTIVYTGLGIVAILFGLTIKDIPFFNEILFRKMLGPLLIIIGFILLGAIPIRSGYFNEMFMKVKKWMDFRNSALSLGFTMGFLFCPTLFSLFFGFVLSSSAMHPIGIMDPVFFSVGTALPLILYALFLSAGTRITEKMLPNLVYAHHFMKYLSAGIFILSGIYETLGYWFI